MIREGRLTMSMTANVKTTKRCAFCKHWYDPANSAIEPKGKYMDIRRSLQKDVHEEKLRNKLDGFLWQIRV